VIRSSEKTDDEQVRCRFCLKWDTTTRAQLNGLLMCQGCWETECRNKHLCFHCGERWNRR
jgi:hypothetical protein